jgi:hypothetical protein
MKILEIITENKQLQERMLGGFPVKVVGKVEAGTDAEVDEAIHLDAPHTRLTPDNLHDYASRVKSKTHTSTKDKMRPILHASNLKVLDDNDNAWDLQELARQIMVRPNVKNVIGVNSKMKKSGDATQAAKPQQADTFKMSGNSKMNKSSGKNEVIFDVTLPALSGLIIDEETMEFVEINTCPGAGECKVFCYARKGGYRQFPGSSMSAARYLNYLLNDPTGFAGMLDATISNTAKRLQSSDTKLVVRWHDAGDFFSKAYLDLAYEIARNNPDVEFYAYTKMAIAITGDTPANWLNRFSTGSTTTQSKQVSDFEKQGNTVLRAQVIPSSMFNDLLAKEGNTKVKDADGQTQFKDENAINTLKDRMAAEFNIDSSTILTYDQALNTPVGTKPHWSVIVPPGAGDLAAKRRDVLNTFLLIH